MKNVRFLITLFLFIPFLVQSQNLEVSVVKNYKNWHWDSVFVAKNNYISLAVVPDAAGRILEYNLAETPSLWLNPALFGKSFSPTDEVKKNEWRNFGGYRLVPIPVDNCAINEKGEKVKRWPPPAIIGDSPYKTKIETDAKGRKLIKVESGIQNLPVPLYNEQAKQFSSPKYVDEQLQYKRSLFIGEETSLVFIEHVLINKGNKPVDRGIMTTSQHVSCTDTALQDGKNYVAYIPFDAEHKLPDGKQYEITGTAQEHWNFVNKNRMPLDKNNPEHVEKYLNQGKNWTGEVAPGVFEIHYDYNLMSGFHMISSKSWLAYVNKINQTAFVKLLEPFNKNLNYEFGTNACIYNSALETGYLETEVKTPIYHLEPKQSVTYREVHGAAKILSTPILEVNRTGIITKRMGYDEKLKNIAGEYGVFIAGDAVLAMYDNWGKLLKEVFLGDVSPVKPLQFSLNSIKDLKEAKLFIKDKANKNHLLDSYKTY